MVLFENIIVGLQVHLCTLLPSARTTRNYIETIVSQKGVQRYIRGNMRLTESGDRRYAEDDAQ